MAQEKTKNSYEKAGSVLVRFPLYIGLPGTLVWDLASDLEKTYGEKFLTKTELFSRTIEEWRELEWYALLEGVSLGSLVLGVALSGIGKYSRWWHSNTN